MADVKKISQNTLFLFFRMGLLMIIGLYTTRAILEALGVVDLGISNVVSSVILIFDFASSSLTNASQRYLNIGLGRNDSDITWRYFAQSLTVHIMLALAIVLLLETGGLWLVKQKLVIPEERMTAALWCYHLSVVGVFVRIVKICYDSNIIAREKMSFFAYVGIFEGIAKLGICFLVIYNSSFDKLIYYSVLFFLISVVITVIEIIYCLAKFPESRAFFYFEKSLFKELLSFVGINSFGVVSWAFGIQGVNIVLNMFFGPVVNGARGIASTVQRVIIQFSTNIDLAVKPQITKAYAQNEVKAMISLAEKTAKYIFFMILTISMPIIMQTDSVLQTWLTEVPEYTSVYIKILMIDSMINVVNTQYTNMSMAVGKIKNQQVYGRLFTLSNLPLSWGLLHFIHNPYLPVIIQIMMSLMYLLYCIHDTNRNLNYQDKKSFNNVLIPCSKITVIVVASSFAVIYLPLTFSNDLNFIFTFFLKSLIMMSVSLIIIWIFGINIEDKNRFIKHILKK